MSYTGGTVKVDNPRFDHHGLTDCRDCPFTGPMHSWPSLVHQDLCAAWGNNHLSDCPTTETYAEACRLAEQANKGENSDTF